MTAKELTALIRREGIKQIAIIGNRFADTELVARLLADRLKLPLIESSSGLKETLELISRRRKYVLHAPELTGQALGLPESVLLVCPIIDLKYQLINQRNSGRQLAADWLDQYKQFDRRLPAAYRIEQFISRIIEPQRRVEYCEL